MCDCHYYTLCRCIYPSAIIIIIIIVICIFRIDVNDDAGSDDVGDHGYGDDDDINTDIHNDDNDDCDDDVTAAEIDDRKTSADAVQL